MYEEYYHLDPVTGEKYPQSIYHDKKPLKVLGDPTIRRVEAGEKVTGEAKFANDMFFTNPLYIKFKRCPYSHARVTSIDTTQAKALSGVVMVLTHADIPELISSPPYHYVLQEECWHEGAEVAAVAAEEEDIAEEALALIDVEYEVLPFVLYAEDAMKPGAYILHGDTNQVGSTATVCDRGDFDAAYAAAPIKVDGKYDSVTKPWSGSRDVAPIENESLTAIWTGHEIRAWVSDQNPFGTSRTLAAQLELPYNQVSCPPCYSGVGFGGKGSNNKGKILAAWMARETNRPVKWFGDNDGQFSTSRSQQQGQHLTIKAGVNSDGQMVAYSNVDICNSGSFGGRGSTDAHTVARVMLNTPNMYLEGQDWATNTQGIGVPRCVSHPMPSHMISLHLDEVAEAVDMDPADFLVKNCSKGSGVGVDLDNPDWDVGSNPMPDMLVKLIADSGWKAKWKGWGTPVSVSGTKRRGIGIAMHCCRHGYLSNPMSAMIKANNDGTWNLVVGSRDVGGGTRTQLALFAAEELGVPAKDVIGARVDTAYQQESKNPGGSTVTRGSGTPIILACRDAKRQLFELAIAAGLIEADKPEDLETADGFVYLKADPATKVAIKSVCAKQGSQHMPAPGYGGMIIGRGSYNTKRDRHMHRQWNLAVATVEVDTDTGEVEVLDIWHANGLGRTVFYRGAMNQTFGGTIMSMGKGLYEGVIKDELTGVTLNANYLDYKIPTHMDIPNIHVDLYEEIDTYGPFGAHGMAEPACGPNSPAVLNAIYNACGARIRSTMATPDKILAAIGKA